jgi:ABC-type Fe3+-hydroxamate transport system substrate-binding protein
VAFGRLPAYSGATVPDSNRLPARKPLRRDFITVRRRLLARAPAEDDFRSAARRRVGRGPKNGAVTRRLLFAFAVLACAAACAAPRSPSAATGTGRSRLVALVPFVADDAFALGAGAQLVAVSAFTDDPRARSLPRVADFTSVDTERIVALHPDAVVGIPSQGRLVEPLRSAGIVVVLLPDDAYDDIFANLRAIGALTGRRRQAQRLIVRLQRTTAQLQARTRAFVRHPSVFVVLGSGPIWTAGSSSYIATLIALAGGRNAAAGLRAAYGQYSAEALLRAQPDVLVTDPAIRLDAALGREPWRSLRAVRLHRVYTVDPAAIIERPGPYYNEGIRWLVDRLTPLAT